MEAELWIIDEASYDAALAEVDTYFINEPRRGTPEADRFTILTDLTTADEAKAWPITLDGDQPQTPSVR